MKHDKGMVLLQFYSAWSPIGDAILEAFFADVVQADYIWEEEQGFGQKYSVRDGEATLVDEWDELRWNRGDDQK